jgi:hypothetical protein
VQTFAQRAEHVLVVLLALDRPAKPVRGHH